MFDCHLVFLVLTVVVYRQLCKHSCVSRAQLFLPCFVRVPCAQNPPGGPECPSAGGLPFSRCLRRILVSHRSAVPNAPHSGADCVIEDDASNFRDDDLMEGVHSLSSSNCSDFEELVVQPCEDKNQMWQFADNNDSPCGPPLAF